MRKNYVIETSDSFVVQIHQTFVLNIRFESLKGSDSPIVSYSWSNKSLLDLLIKAAKHLEESHTSIYDAQLYQAKALYWNFKEIILETSPCSFDLGDRSLSSEIYGLCG